MFAQRKDGKIVGLYANLQKGYAEEEIKDDDAEVLAHIASSKELPPDETVVLKARIEKLESLLVAKSVLTATEIKPDKPIKK